MIYKDPSLFSVSSIEEEGGNFQVYIICTTQRTIIIVTHQTFVPLKYLYKTGQTPPKVSVWYQLHTRRSLAKSHNEDARNEVDDNDHEKAARTESRHDVLRHEKISFAVYSNQYCTLYIWGKC